MRVFIAGSTGVLGRRLVRCLAERGHEAVGLVRNDRGATVVRERGGEPRHGDLLDSGSVLEAARGCEVVVHAVTSIPLGIRLTPEDFAENDRLRREGVRALTAAAAAVGARRYLQQSVVWVASAGDGVFFDESSPLRRNEVSASAIDAEMISREAGERYGFEVAILRGGWFYAADAAHTRTLGRGLASRRLPVIGKGDALWATVHVDDVASAFTAAIESDTGGTWHVVDDEGTRSGDFLDGLASRLGARRPPRLPAWLARILVGAYSVDFATRSDRTSNARLKADLGWAPEFPTYREGLDRVVEAWAEEGFIV